MGMWNLTGDPIASRLRNEEQLQLVQDNHSMIYHEPTKMTALIMDVWVVDPVPGEDDTIEEDRYVRYTTENEVKSDYAVDLDDEGWLWYDELTPQQL